MQIRTFSLVAVLALGLPACTTSMGKVNVSSRDSQVAVDVVNHKETQAIQAAVIAAVREAHPVKGNATFWLLTGSGYGAYQAVGAKLGQGYVLPDQAPAGTPFYGIRSIKAADQKAEVGVAHPGSSSALGASDAHVELRKTADGKGWRVVSITERPAGFASVGELLAAEGKSAPAAAAAPAKQEYNWAQRNLLGKQTEEQKAAEAAKKEAKAQAKAEKEAAEKAAAQAKADEEAKQPKKYNWVQRNLLGKQTDEQKAAAAAEKEAKAKAKAEKEAAETAEKEAKAKAKAEKEAADKAAAQAKAEEEAKQPKKFSWVERNILGKKTEEQ